MQIGEAGPAFDRSRTPKDSGFLWAGDKPRIGEAEPTAPKKPLALPAAPKPGAPAAATPAAAKVKRPKQKPVPRQVPRVVYLDRIFFSDLILGILVAGVAIAYIALLAAAASEGRIVTNRLQSLAPFLVGSAIVITVGSFVRAGKDWALWSQFVISALGLLSLLFYGWYFIEHELQLEARLHRVLLGGSVGNTMFSIFTLIMAVKAARAPKPLLIAPGVRASSAALPAAAPAADAPPAAGEAPPADEDAVADAEPVPEEGAGEEVVLSEADGQAASEAGEFPEVPPEEPAPLPEAAPEPAEAVELPEEAEAMEEIEIPDEEPPAEA